MKRWEESQGFPPPGSEWQASVQHPGLERWELAFVLGPAATYRNNEDKLRGGRGNIVTPWGVRVSEKEEGAEAEKRAEEKRGGKEGERERRGG